MLIRILLVNQMALICDIIAAVLENQADMQVVGKAASIDEGIKKAVLFQPDIVLVSARMAGSGALLLTKKLTKQQPAIKILIFGMPTSKEKLIEYVEAGAAGCVFQNDTVQCLIKSIRAAANEEAVLSPSLVAALMTRLSRVARTLDDFDPTSLEKFNLTTREQEVLELMNQNFSNKQIAEHLCIQVGTVKNHVHSILNKLGVKSREEAAAYQDLIKGK
jgi:DNA-binding NarL/FixJ family response regulator